MDSPQAVLDFIMEKYPVNNPGCVAMTVFHSYMLNDVYPAYARLVAAAESDEVWISTEPHEVTPEMSQGFMLTYDGNTTSYPVYRLDGIRGQMIDPFDEGEPAVPPDEWNAVNPMVEPFPLQDE